ncbi:MAG: hypothetical protein ACUVTL_09350 [Thermoproteota archaeon]
MTLQLIDPGLRKTKRSKIQKYFEIIAEIIRRYKIEFLPREALKSELRKRGLDVEEIRRAIIEAERDHVLNL